MRIDITSPQGIAVLPEVVIDGHERQDPRLLLLFQDESAAGVWRAGERQYAVDVYVDGNLQISIPDRSEAVDAQYDALEAAGHGPEPGTYSSEWEVDIARQWLEILPGRVALTKLAHLERTAKIFIGNANVLLEHLNRMQDPTWLLPIYSSREAFEEFVRETERHLHNCVASAASRVVYYRGFIDDLWPDESPLRREYQRKIKEEFDTSPLHRFAIDLRNFILHWRLPVSQGKLLWSRGDPFAHRMMLKSADLLRWSRWTGRARKYIEDSGEFIDLADTVRAYAEKVRTFDQWVVDTFALEHATEIETYKHAESEYMMLLRQSGSSDTSEGDLA